MATASTREPAQYIAPNIWSFDSFASRALDIIASALGLLFLAPFFAVVAFFIKRDTPGPVFYGGLRVGKNGRLFRIWKFRTMYERSDSYQGPRITAKGDSRVTPLGRFLRETKINELPQLWNVLVGDMSLVGPRPEDPEIAAGWPEHIRAEVLSVRPGLTSPATVIFRSEEEMLSGANLLDDYLRTVLPDKLRLDRIYIRRRNLLTDLDVIFMTLLHLLPRLRYLQVPETTLYWGPLSQFISRYLNWFCIDTLVAFFAMGAAASIWRLEAPLNIGFQRWVGISALAGLCFSVINALLGLTQTQWRRASATEAVPLAFSAALSTGALVFFDVAVFHQWQFHTFRPHIPFGVLVVAGMLSLFGFTALRYRERLLTGLASFWLRNRPHQNLLGERVLLIGAGENSQLATWLLTRSDFAELFTIAGIVDDDPRKQGLYYDGFRILGSTRELATLVKRHDIGLAIFTIANIDDDERQRILSSCRALGIKVVLFPDIMAQIKGYFQSAAVQHPSAELANS